MAPSVSPSASPSASPSVSPSGSPSLSPSGSPSVSPSVSPSRSPSGSPSVSPSTSPSASASPSVSPSASASPSQSPSVSPSASPSVAIVGSSATQIWSYPYGDLALCEIDWVAGDQGLFEDYEINGIEGFCYMGITVPSAFPPPTNNYDIEILDPYGIDIFGGSLNDRSSTLAEQAVPMVGTASMARRVKVTETLTLRITNNTTDHATGKIFLYFEPAKRLNG